jgi:hypothetical protein
MNEKSRPVVIDEEDRGKSGLPFFRDRLQSWSNISKRRPRNVETGQPLECFVIRVVGIDSKENKRVVGMLGSYASGFPAEVHPQ